SMGAGVGAANAPAAERRLGRLIEMEVIAGLVDSILEGACLPGEPARHRFGALEPVRVANDVPPREQRAHQIREVARFGRVAARFPQPLERGLAHGASELSARARPSCARTGNPREHREHRGLKGYGIGVSAPSWILVLLCVLRVLGGKILWSVGGGGLDGPAWAARAA